MRLEEIQELRNFLLENDFKELKPSEDSEVINEEYVSNKDISRKLEVKLDTKTVNDALTTFCFRTYYNGAYIPTNQDNSAFIIKAVEDEETDEKNFYIQPVWKKEIIKELDDLMNQSEQFIALKNEILERNKKIKNEKLKAFARDVDFVALAIKKTGFNLNKDFIISIGYAVVEDNKIIKHGQLLVNDDIDEEKTLRYTAVDEIYGKSAFDFIRITLPTMPDCRYKDKFYTRLNALKLLQKIINNKHVIWHGANEKAPFLERLFEREEEEIPENKRYNSLISSESCVKEAFEWLEPKESDSLFDIGVRCGIQRREKGALSDAILTADIAIYLRNKIKMFKDRKK